MIKTNKMAEQGKNHQLFQDSWFQFDSEMKNNEKCSSSSSTTTTSSIGEESTVSNGSSITSSDLADDASSSSSASSSFSANSSGALYDLSEIMTQLPIKRGLSKFYQGKSESFTSLSRVTSVEDLAKRATPCRRRNNKAASKSIATGLHSYKSYTLPKAVIAKKTAKGSSFPSRGGGRGGLMNSYSNSKPHHH